MYPDDLDRPLTDVESLLIAGWTRAAGWWMHQFVSGRHDIGSALSITRNWTGD